MRKLEFKVSLPEHLSKRFLREIRNIAIERRLEGNLPIIFGRIRNEIIQSAIEDWIKKRKNEKKHCKETSKAENLYFFPTTEDR